jgi:putative membrane protein
VTAGRVAAALAGLVVVGLAWAVVPRLGLPPFSAHMAAHMGLVAVAAPLLAWGLAGGPLDPVGRVPFGALAASMIELVGVWVWHAPALHDAACHAPWVFAGEQVTFLGTGLVLWVAALGGGPERRRARSVEGVAGLLFTSMHMTLLGALLGLAPRPLYGMATLSDQQVGGAIMLLVGGVAYLIGALVLVTDLLRGPR